MKVRFYNATDWIGLGCAPEWQFVGSVREDGSRQTFAEFREILEWDYSVARDTGAIPAVCVLDSMTTNEKGERWQKNKILERVEFAARRGGVVAFDLEPEANYSPELRPSGRLESQADLWHRLLTGFYADGSGEEFTAYSSLDTETRAAGRISFRLRRRLAECCYWTKRPVPYFFWRWPRHVYDSLHDGPTIGPLFDGGAIKAYYREVEGDSLSAWRNRVTVELRALHSVPIRSGRGRVIAWINTHTCYRPHEPLSSEVLREMLAVLAEVGRVDTVCWWCPGNYWGLAFDHTAGWYRVMAERMLQK